MAMRRSPARSCRSIRPRSPAFSSASWWCGNCRKASPAAASSRPRPMSSATPPGTPIGGMTPRNRSLFLERGHAYVYLAYGVSWMLNVSSEARGIGAGVLIRALEPLEGIAIMRRNRGIERLRDLARGPGRLAAALRIDRSLDGLDLCQKGPLWLARDDHEPGRDRSKSDQDRHYAGRGPAVAVLCPRQPVRQRREVAQCVKRRRPARGTGHDHAWQPGSRAFSFARRRCLVATGGRTLDTLPQSNHYPTKPCGGRPWMSASGFAVSASANTRRISGTTRSTRTCCRV